MTYRYSLYRKQNWVILKKSMNKLVWQLFVSTDSLAKLHESWPGENVVKWNEDEWLISYIKNCDTGYVWACIFVWNCVWVPNFIATFLSPQIKYDGTVNYFSSLNFSYPNATAGESRKLKTCENHTLYDVHNKFVDLICPFRATTMATSQISCWQFVTVWCIIWWQKDKLKNVYLCTRSDIFSCLAENDLLYYKLHVDPHYGTPWLSVKVLLVLKAVFFAQCNILWWHWILNHLNASSFVEKKSQILKYTCVYVKKKTTRDIRAKLYL